MEKHVHVMLLMQNCLHVSSRKLGQPLSLLQCGDDTVTLSIFDLCLPRSCTCCVQEHSSVRFSAALKSAAAAKKALLTCWKLCSQVAVLLEPYRNHMQEPASAVISVVLLQVVVGNNRTGEGDYCRFLQPTCSRSLN